MFSDLIGLGPDNPKKLPLININPDVTQRQAIAGNLQNAPAAFDLAALVNQFSASELNKQLERLMPGYGTLRDSATKTIQNLMNGEATDYERHTLERMGAELGVQSGTVGSGFGNYKTLGLGIDFLNRRTQEGLNSAAQWIASVPKAPQFDFTRMFQTPDTRWNQMFQQAQANLPIRSFNNWVDTLPSVQERAGKEMLDWIENTGRSIVGSYAGQVGGFGGMGGGGSGGGGASGPGTGPQQWGNYGN